MSLKAFHIFFILTALGLMAFVAFWSSGGILRAAAAGGFLLGTLYLAWFLKKHGKL